MITFKAWSDFLIPGVIMFNVLFLVGLSIYPAYWTTKTALDLRKYLNLNKDKQVHCTVYHNGKQAVSVSQTYRMGSDGIIKFGDNEFWVDIEIKDRAD